MYIKCITYVVVMCIDNYICHAPLYTSPAVHPISLPPPAFILIFQISEKLQTAGTFYLFFFPPSLPLSPQTCQIYISFSSHNRGLFSYQINTGQMIKCRYFALNQSIVPAVSHQSAKLNEGLWQHTLGKRRLLGFSESSQ